jgi:hypothetical protein
MAYIPSYEFRIYFPSIYIQLCILIIFLAFPISLLIYLGYKLCRLPKGLEAFEDDFADVDHPQEKEETFVDFINKWLNKKI